MTANNIYTNLRILTVFLSLTLAFACSRDIEDLEPAAFPVNGNVFIDGFEGGLEYAAFGGSKLTAFQVDGDVTYDGNLSMRFEVPDEDDPEGAFAGGAFTLPSGRDFTGFDALTFWARASQPASINEIGFGNDLENSPHVVVLTDVKVNTNWQQFIIPIPDPSKLTQERGMLFYSEAPENGRGYTFWIDEVKFEKLGTIARPRPVILDGQEQDISTETGEKLTVGGRKITFNLPSGVDQTTDIGPGYYSFASSNPSVATVNELGIVTILDEGAAVITATLGTQDAVGSLSLESTGEALLPSTAAPTPTVSSDSVISMFSNVYEDVTVDTWNPRWEFSTAEVADVKIGDDDVKRYKMLNFVGILTEANPIDASAMTHFHLDIWTPDATELPASFKVLLVDLGADGRIGGTDDSSHEVSFTSPTLQSESWVSLDIPLSAFTGLTNRSTIGQLVLSGDLPNVFVDNVYYYQAEETMQGATEPTMAAPTPSQDANQVVSLFSDAYTDVTVDTWRTDWSAATFEDITVDGNATKKYSNLDFVGIETVSNPVDASNMTNFRMDVWSPDFTLFGIKLVDFGPDGAFGGGDDAEFQVDLNTPMQGEWVSLDIPLSDFTGLTTRANIGQYILVGQPTGTTTVFVDNVYFYGESMGTATEPTMAAPTPMEDAGSVVSLFSDAYTDVTVDTWRTDWSAATFEDITVDGNATKKYSNLDFAGIETVSNTVDASNMTNFRMDVWSPDFTSFSIKLVDFGPDGGFGGGDDAEHQVDISMPAQGEWVSLDIPLSDFTGLTTRGNIAQFIIVGQPTGTTTVFVDNVYFYGESMGAATEPMMAAPTPMEDAANVVSLFSDAYTDVNVDTWRTDWSATGFEDIMVAGNATKKYSNLDFAGIETVSSTVDASNMSNFRMDVWSPDFTSFSIKLVDFGPDGGFGGGDDAEHQVDISMPAQGEWVSLDIPLSDFTGLTTRGNIAQYIIVGQPTGTTTVFVDNVYFYGESMGAATEPVEAAPTPMQDAANVVSLFSDAYTDVSVDTWRTDWSSAAFEDVMVAGNATKKYSSLDFVGIETVANTVDASDMTTLHLDLWSPDFTVFGIKLVDFGADGAFGGGDDVEHQINFDMPMQGGWLSLDIPLSDFTGLTTRGNIAQYILVGQPTGTATIFVDNFYFYK